MDNETINEFVQKGVSLLPSQEIILHREQSIKKLGLSFNSPIAQLIVAMTNTFFVDGKLKATEYIVNMFNEKSKEVNKKNDKQTG